VTKDRLAPVVRARTDAEERARLALATAVEQERRTFAALEEARAALTERLQRPAPAGLVQLDEHAAERARNAIRAREAQHSAAQRQRAAAAAERVDAYQALTLVSRVVEARTAERRAAQDRREQATADDQTAARVTAGRAP
jgi:hypothetical protein